jgi:hypothetical protein
MPTWRFILTYGVEVIDGVQCHCLVVHTINGAFVSKRALAGPIPHHCVFASARGFDYFAYVLNGSLSIGKVYYLDERKRSEQPVCEKIQSIE